MKQTLDLNLAHRPFRNNTLLWVGYGTAFALLAGFSVWLGLAYTAHTRLLADLENRLSSFQSRSGELDRRENVAASAIDTVDLKQLVAQSEMANQVIARKAFSWTRLFNLLEEIQPWQVRMNAVRPVFQKVKDGSAPNADPKKVEIVVEGTAKTFLAFTEFQNGIHSDSRFGRVEPISLKRVKTGEILFELRFFYDSADREPDADPATEAAVNAGAEIAGSTGENPGEAASDVPVTVATRETPGILDDAPAVGDGAIVLDATANAAGPAAREAQEAQEPSEPATAIAAPVEAKSRPAKTRPRRPRRIRSEDDTSEGRQP